MKKCRTWVTANKASFTLIELLVVIAIIAILISASIPVFQQFKRRAQIVSAKNSAKNVEFALRAYVSEYNKWPSCIDDSAFSLADEIVEVLRGENIAGDNPRKICFLETDTNSVLDAWRNPLRAMVDDDFDNTIDFYGEDIYRPVIAWSWYTSEAGAEEDKDQDDCIIKSW